MKGGHLPLSPGDTSVPEGASGAVGVTGGTPPLRGVCSPRVPHPSPKGTSRPSGCPLLEATGRADVWRWGVNEPAQTLERLITDLWLAWKAERVQSRKDRIRQQIRRAEAELARLEKLEHEQAGNGGG